MLVVPREAAGVSGCDLQLEPGRVVMVGGRERSAGDSREPLDRVCMARGGSGAVMHDLRPRKRTRRQAAVLGVTCMAREEIESPTAQVRLADGVSITGTGWGVGAAVGGPKTWASQNEIPHCVARVTPNTRHSEPTPPRNSSASNQPHQERPTPHP